HRPGVHLVGFAGGEGGQLGWQEDQSLKTGQFFGSAQGTGQNFPVFRPQTSFGDLQGFEPADRGDEFPHVFRVGFGEEQAEDEPRHSFEDRPVQENQKDSGGQGDEKRGEQGRNKHTHAFSVLFWSLAVSILVFRFLREKMNSSSFFGGRG